MKVSLGRLALIGVLGALFPCCQADAGNGYDMEPTLTLSQPLGSATFVYQQFDAEVDFPCPLVSLKAGTKVLATKELCLYKARDHSPFDLRKDVSFNAIRDAAIVGHRLSYTLDVSLRRPDAFLQKCSLTFSDKAIGEPECQLVDRPE
ncbi:hypothetical protein PVT67_16895 [Gallaecimonas kandeliae]|uniref:hypothetical protein n=1 Tax=Gallaecimonas kandeliae TaxID=3029055 RepID=UPI0026491553|nr:hypothetical protein [Gallaecimonas kandeliae]WKE65320.1 hypothetical protein PVT67_16895 [Gallaecimonas kandeliae]